MPWKTSVNCNLRQCSINMSGPSRAVYRWQLVYSDALGLHLICFLFIDQVSVFSDSPKRWIFPDMFHHSVCLHYACGTVSKRVRECKLTGSLMSLAERFVLSPPPEEDYESCDQVRAMSSSPVKRNLGNYCLHQGNQTNGKSIRTDVGTWSKCRNTHEQEPLVLTLLSSITF